MANDYGLDSALFDEDPDIALAKARSAALARRPPVTMPSSGVEAPKPDVPQLDTARQIEAEMVRRMFQRPDESGLIAQAKAREEQGRQNMLAGLALSLKGGSTLQPFGGHLLQQSLKAQGGMEIPGGWGTATSEGVTWNPAKQQEAALGHLQALAGFRERAETSKENAALRTQMMGGNQLQRQQQQLWHLEDNARNHFDQVTKDTREVLNQARVVGALPANGQLTPNQQMSLIILLNKFQDPGSVVREGEFNRVAQAQGLLQRWGNLPQKIATGQPIPPAAVADIRNVIRLYTEAAENTMRSNAADYFQVARQRGLDPTNIVTDRRWHPAPPKEPPPGAVLPRNQPRRRSTDEESDEPPPGAVRPGRG